MTFSGRGFWQGCRGRGDQGLIEPQKAARGHATRTDGEIQHVTKFKFT